MFLCYYVFEGQLRRFPNGSRGREEEMKYTIEFCLASGDEGRKLERYIILDENRRVLGNYGDRSAAEARVKCYQKHNKKAKA